MKAYMTRQEVAQQFPISFSHLAHLACQGRGPRYAVIGRRAIYCREAVEKHLSKPLRTYSVQESDAALSLLTSNRIPPTVKAFRELTGRKIGKLENAAQPSALRLAYGKHRYWKLDGISPLIRAKAKRAATRDGDNIGPWVEKAIIAILAQRSDSDIL